jgi:hypothetical protein
MGQALRPPLKVAAQDDHNATVQGLHQANVVERPPSPVVQVGIKGQARIVFRYANERINHGRLLR